MRYGGHAFGFTGRGGRDPRFRRFHDHRAEALDWIEESAPCSHVGPGDPPVFLSYPAQDRPSIEGEARSDPTPSAVLGLRLEEELKAAGDEVHRVYPGHKDPECADMAEFLIARLKGSRACPPGTTPIASSRDRGTAEPARPWASPPDVRGKARTQPDRAGEVPVIPRPSP